MNIVVTSGGVREKIDNVRSITNSSSGKLGYKIVTELFNKVSDCTVFYLHSSTAKSYENEILGDRIKNIEITDTNSLLQNVRDILTNNKIDVFIHSMAVADYTTDCVIDLYKFVFDLCSEKHENLDFDTVMGLLKSNTINSDSKISSDIDNPIILLKKTPKIISEIKKLSPYTFLVGFKLLDSVSEEELFDVGFNLLRRNRCNLVVANDIAKIRKGNHRGLIIYPEKNYDIVEGKDNISEFLVQKILERCFVKHPKSIQMAETHDISLSQYSEIRKMGKWLDKLQFLPRVINHDRIDKVGTYGNMSFKSGEEFFITSRNVNKSDLQPEDISKITKVKMLNDDSSIYSNVSYSSVLKPSIDTTIHSEIYKNSDYTHIVHIHTDNVFLGLPLIEKSYPCGSDLECKAILAKLKIKDVSVIQMYKHGLIILGYNFEDCKNKIEELFNTIPYIDYSSHVIDKECEEHIIQVTPGFVTKESLYPLKLNDLNIGCLFEKKEEGIHFGIYTMENIRGRNLNIVKKYLNLYEKPYFLHTTSRCAISDFYINKFGFEIFNQEDTDNIILKRGI